jgi:hypothetical protein
MLTAPGDRTSDRTGNPNGSIGTVMIRYDGLTYGAEPVARGAAYEIYSSVPADGFMSNPRPDAPDIPAPAFRRFVHATEVDLLAGPAPQPDDAPLSVPLSATMSWAEAHRLSQAGASAASHPALRSMRDTVRIRRGTRMVKILSGRQLAGTLRGWLPQGFCHREYDIAHLRTPGDLAVLATDRTEPQDDSAAVFMLRWRAVDAADFATPYDSEFAGLTAMSPHQRVGPPVLGTGFAPTNRHIIPEFVTDGLGDLPLPAHAELIAFTPDGTEVLLYRYLAEQRAWGRLAGKQWRGLLDGIEGLAGDQEYFPIPDAPTRLMGRHDGHPYEAVADPRENEFLVLAKVRALRHAVTDAVRLSPRVVWRGEPCTVVRDSDEWLRLRLIHPSPAALEATGTACMERGIYEAWAPAAEVRNRRDAIVRYPA